MSGRLRTITLLLVTAALAVGALGCGDDEGSGVDVTIPTIETPTETTESLESTTTAPESGGVPTEEDSGGTSPGSGGGSGSSGGTGSGSQDSATNDTPPDSGSPEEAFEQACKQNPEICD